MRRAQGTYHGFLTLHELDGRTIAFGDLVQVVHGDRVTSRLTFRFKDGSLDDETTIYTQRQVFRLVSDHHVQRGPSFPKPVDALVEANGDITLRDGDPAKPTTTHIDLPPDTYNGMQEAILLNLSLKTPETKISMVLPSGKGRLVKLSIKPAGEDEFVIGYIRRKATNLALHIELGGVTGVVAPIVGKEPKDIHVWVMDGESPSVVQVEAQFFDGGPVWRAELAQPTRADKR